MIQLDQDTLKNSVGTIVAALIVGGSIIWLGLTQRFTGVYSGTDNAIFVVDGLTGNMRRCFQTRYGGQVLYLCTTEGDPRKIFAPSDVAGFTDQEVDALFQKWLKEKSFERQ